MPGTCPDAERPGVPGGYHVRWLITHWRPYRRELPWLLALTIANATVLVIYPIFIKRIIESIEHLGGMHEILRNVAFLAGFGALQFGTYVALQTMRARLNIRFDFGVRMRAFENLERMGPGFFGRFRTGDIVTRLTDDVSEKLSWYMCSGLLRTVEALTIIVFGVIMMVSLNPTLTLYTAGPLPVLVGLFFLTASRLHERYARVQRSISRLNDALENAFSGIRVVKAFAAEPFQRRIVGSAIEDQRRAEVRAVRWQTVIDSLYGHIWQFAIIGVLLAGGRMAIRGEISLGVLVAFDAYVLLLVWPMFDVGNFLVRGRLSAVSVGRIRELEEAEPEVRERDDHPPPCRRPDGDLIVDHEPPPGGSPERLPVRFENVSYVYPGSETPVIDGVDFEARPAALTAVVGEIGSGKSTVAAIIPRLIDPSSGRVLIGGRDTREWNALELRRAIGLVPQEPLLFSTTVEENVRFGRAGITDADVEAAIETAGLADEIITWPRGLRTPVGSRGLRLSGGQKQRVALARALAGRPSILILDDCTSSLDADREDRIWRAIFRTLPHSTTLVVTHRPATLERADRILVLDGGRVTETGTFRELNREGSIFHRLYLRWRLVDRTGV